MSARLFPLALVLILLASAAHTARAEEIDFQSVAASGSGGQSAQGGGSGSTGAQVQNVDMGDVTGTVCDCGEVGPGDGEGAGGTGGQGTQGAPKGFPKYPLYAFAAGPATICFFTNLCEPTIRIDPTPERTPTSNVPEPFTFATLSAGLAALAGIRARRRRRA